MRAEQNPCLFPIDQPSNLSRARAHWERFKRSRRAKDLYWLWLFSAAFFAVGLIGDLNAWWDEWGYLGNIVAGATAASFGIPVAATVIQWIVRKESEWTSKRDVVTIAWRTVRSIHRSLALIDADQASALSHETEAVLGKLTDFVNLDPADDYPSRQQVSEMIEDYRELLKGIARLRAVHHMVSESESVRNRYRLLNDQVLMQAESLDMVIMSDDLRARLGHATMFAYPGRLLTEGDENSPLRDQRPENIVDKAFASTAHDHQSARELLRTVIGYTLADLAMTQQTLQSMDQAWRVAKEAYEHLDDLKRQFD